VRALRLGCALALGLLACAGGFDVSRLRERLAAPAEPALPELRQSADGGLPAPQGLRATSGQLREIPLRWDPLLDEHVGGYALERAAERDGPFVPLAALAGGAATVYVDRGPRRWPDASDPGPEGLADGETHFYRVRAFSREGILGERSEVVAATTAPPPDAPTGLRAWSHRPRRVPLDWEPSSDPHAAGYVVERSPTAEGPFATVARIDDRWQTTWVDEGLGDLRVFYYRIAAFNGAGGRGPTTQPVRAVTKPEPLPPIGLRVIEQRLGENRLGWEPNVEQDLKGYRLLRQRESQTEPELVSELGSSETQAVDGEVAPGERVSYSLVAFDRDGLESAASHAIEVKSEGYGLSATVREDGIHLVWRDRDDEGYARARVMLEGWPSSRELAVVEGTSWVHADVRPGGRYRYRVVLVRADGAAAAPSRMVEIRVPKSWKSWLPGQDSNLRPSG
jgi:fibronectin type 3 domain-containing protein